MNPKFLKKLGLPLLPVLSGIFAYASFPMPDLGYLAWITFVPLLIFLLAVKRLRTAFAGGALAGLVQFLLILTWIPGVLTQYGGIPGALSWALYVALALLMCLYAGLASSVTRFCMQRGGEKYLIVFPFAWVVMEYARGHIVFGGFPWLLSGYSQTGFLRLIQVADIAGVYGVSFVIAWVNVAFVWAGMRLLRRAAPMWPVTTAFVLVLFCFGYGEASLRRWDRLEPDSTAAMLQGNISADEPESEQARKLQEGYGRMADLISRIPVDLLILPESPSPLPFQHDRQYRESMRQLAQRYLLGLVFNNIADVTRDGKTRYYNSAYFLDNEGREVARYDKIHLVPYGEYIPFRSLFFFADSITRDVADFTPGSEHTVASLDGHPMSALVCFEAVFPELAGRFVRDGSRLIINLTNDAWYGRTAAPYQHLSMARWRAVENRRYVLRAANSGISAVIKPTGALQAATALFREEVCVGLFSFLEARSFYTRFGDVFVLACAIIMSLLVILCYRKGASRQPAG